MSFVERRVTYFEAKGGENTATVLRAVEEYVEKAGVKDVVVASTTGETGVLASKLLKGLNLVVVTHHTGFVESGLQELKEENRQQILANGAKILTATHALSGAERAIRKDFGTIGPLEIIANTLRLLGEGTKVCVEIVLMTADAGLVPTDKDVVAVAGSGRGADTALLIKPANASKFFDLEVREVIAKPRCLE
ncbi:MAG: pyruvate kinase alpha/beta domain-containing protein [Candidatus Bathyarchaeia archaeon]